MPTCGVSGGKALVIGWSRGQGTPIGGMLGPDFMWDRRSPHPVTSPAPPTRCAAIKGESPWAQPRRSDVDNGSSVVAVHAKEVGWWPTQETAQGRRRAVSRPRTRTARVNRSRGTLRGPVATVQQRHGCSTRSHPTAIARAAVDEWRDLPSLGTPRRRAASLARSRLRGVAVLWRKVMPRLSAGQGPERGHRMVVERERRGLRFRSATWWGSTAPHQRRAASGFGAALIVWAEPRLPPAGLRRERGADGQERCPSAGRGGGDVRRHGPDRALLHRERGDREAFPTLSLRRRSHDLDPAAGGGSQLRFSAQRPCRWAQRLYEQGFITYMRTDSTTLSTRR